MFPDNPVTKQRQYEPFSDHFSWNFNQSSHVSSLGRSTHKYCTIDIYNPLCLHTMYTETCHVIKMIIVHSIILVTVVTTVS